jgi:hypothetical protein
VEAGENVFCQMFIDRKTCNNTTQITGIGSTLRGLQVAESMVTLNYQMRAIRYLSSELFLSSTKT